MAVCRGKVSEGMDFPDNNARAVITVSWIEQLIFLEPFNIPEKAKPLLSHMAFLISYCRLVFRFPTLKIHRSV